ncbi:peptidylprolyl isomerase [Hoyosella sp. G463]|uniref:Peptidylprolyl isomerase n=1 Tax=Lolliginicoccus lacisalsi TaxID=2742202 RepID=A0A927J9S3_9ACTN|nr:peptidylprolyl isomerase [Lolliginicoccus lacisalsi]MBD8505316.1 peptidylprolyl isomerase [Lolliginicoccus lacisalsi]
MGRATARILGGTGLCASISVVLAGCSLATESAPSAALVADAPVGAEAATVASAPASVMVTNAPPLDVTLPRADPMPPAVSCEYPRSGNPARPVSLPPARDVPAEGAATVRLELRRGMVPISLDRSLSPCTVNSFISLAEQGFYTSSVCHRITTRGVYTLQCGDPSGTGTGGPGYGTPAEFPADQVTLDGERRSGTQTTYPRGTVAMETMSGGNSGSRFFVVFDDSPLPPTYTIIGTVDADAMWVLDAIAEAGPISGHSGAPSRPVQIIGVELDR